MHEARRRWPRRTIGGVAYTLTYDAENRLTGMSGSVTASYVYDADGNRVKETIAGVTRVFVGNHYEVDNGVVKKYYYAGATRVAENSGGTLTYLLGDHLGSQALTLDSSGNRLNTNTEIRYYAYGAMRYTAGSTPTSFNFTGQRRDSGSGLLFYNARWYDPAVGRFLQADTVVPEPGNPAGLNRYLYSLGNPLRYTDPSGHYAFEEDPSDQWVYFDPSVRSKYYFTHPEYKQRQLSDTEILGTLLAVPAVALVGGVAIGAAASATGVGADILTSAVTGACADGDCTNEARSVGQTVQNVAKATDPGIALRQQYESAVRALSDKAAQMRATGKSAEEIARGLSAERRALGEQFKALTPPHVLEQIYARNLERYGDKLGPTVEWLVEQGLRQGRSMEQIWESIIEKASRPGGGDIIPKLLNK